MTDLSLEKKRLSAHAQLCKIPDMDTMAERHDEDRIMVLISRVCSLRSLRPSVRA